MKSEPVVTTASLGALVSAFVIFLRVMGWLPLTDEQFNALMALVTVALPIGLAFWPRSKVRPISKMTAPELAAMNQALSRREVPQ